MGWSSKWQPIRPVGVLSGKYEPVSLAGSFYAGLQGDEPFRLQRSARVFDAEPCKKQRNAATGGATTEDEQEELLTMSTVTLGEDVAKGSREWHVVDATGQTLGRLASEIARILRGKHKPSFTPNLDGGDFVIVINCERFVVTGNKLDDVKYYSHSRYPGGLKTRSMREQLDRFPDRIIYEAVKGMMPKTKLGRAQMKKLRIYKGPEHPHIAQQPKTLELGA